MSRTMRYSKILPVGKFSKPEAGCTIIGVGAIGRNIAISLAQVGIGRLEIWDDDLVDEVNLGTQGYRPDQIGQSKVNALATDLKAINPEIKLFSRDLRYSETDRPACPNVFVCVDTMAGRTSIFKSLTKLPNLLIDCRMSPECYRIITIGSSYKFNYKETLFPDNEAVQESCTAKSTLHCAQSAASAAITQFTKHLRKMPIDHDFTYNLFTNELIIEEQKPRKTKVKRKPVSKV